MIFLRVQPLVPPLCRQQARPATRRKTEKERQFAKGRWGQGVGLGDESYNRKKAWSFVNLLLLFKMFIGSNTTVLQNFLRHDTAYALFRLYRILHYLRHDTAGALEYFTVLSFDIKKRLIVLCLQLMTMEAQ